MKRSILFAIRVYQRVFSFDTGLLRLLFPSVGVCRFVPRCSEYTYQAVSKHGIIQGLVLGYKRFIRCHPGNLGGYDPVPRTKTL